jgi:predicted enzyme related to lactoylglutathione lyase
MASNFVWYELMTTDPSVAEAFYKAVVGWSSEPFGGVDFPYTVLKVGDVGVGGIMTLPPEAAAMGMQPAWLGYIHVADVDAATESVRAAGGAVHRAPADIPNVGRFSVVADPQGAIFMLLAPQGEGGPRLSGFTPGRIGWHELYAIDWPSALDFYAGQYGWTRTEAIDMGPMGTYQLFSVDADQGGGMMNKPANVPAPHWLFYFNVDGIEAAAERVTVNGGQILNGPMEVPGGSWIVQCVDPLGAQFALVAPARPAEEAPAKPAAVRKPRAGKSSAPAKRSARK